MIKRHLQRDLGKPLCILGAVVDDCESPAWLASHLCSSLNNALLLLKPRPLSPFTLLLIVFFGAILSWGCLRWSGWPKIATVLHHAKVSSGIFLGTEEKSQRLLCHLLYLVGWVRMWLVPWLPSESLWTLFTELTLLLCVVGSWADPWLSQKRWWKDKENISSLVQGQTWQGLAWGWGQDLKV